MTVTSRNFEFLRETHPELAQLGGFAERYAVTDPASALVKLRTLIEQIVNRIYTDKGLVEPVEPSLFNLITEDQFSRLIPRVILDKMHLLRKQGNQAAHGSDLNTELIGRLVKEAFDVSAWMFILLDGGRREQIGAYDPTFMAEPALQGFSGAERRRYEDQIRRQEARLNQLLLELDQERDKVTAPPPPTPEEIETFSNSGVRVADELSLSEAQTRKFLIDSMLVAAGWDVGRNGKETDEVIQEVELNGLPNASGLGYADYVLRGDDGKPLAVVEAKKTAHSPEKGRTQAKQYGDALERKYGQRPILIYTNGIDTYVWDDASRTPERKIWGLYSKDSLESLLFQREFRQPLAAVEPKLNIAGRPYQLEGIRRVTERFDSGKRKALIVMATGTGKTRVAVSISDILLRANWAKRILFLCDRRELRKQADEVFSEFIKGDPSMIVTASTSARRDSRIYLATYPAMMKCYESFDVGFFDLVIADESHRSIYNKYRDLFSYFDALQIGLTATPVDFVDRNTYRLFDSEEGDPTYNYPLDDAINHVPPYLVPFRVVSVTTHFLREGIKYSQMSEEQRRQIEEDEVNPELIEFESTAIDRQIFNRDTSRHILRNLMENGIRDHTNSLPGKSIIFARSHRHAEHLYEVFNELYPNLGGSFCRVIDNYDPRAEDLITEFKAPASQIRIAISVDMLDTGIDIPEIVNLVFAKPVRSYVKFWQMIGRGTRLRSDLFGPGKDKKEFLIFDHWGNFDYFDEEYEDRRPEPVKSLMQQVFEARVELARVASAELDNEAFQLAVDLIRGDINTLKESKAIAVKEQWRDLRELGDHDVLTSFEAPTHAALIDIAAPLMRWIDTRGKEDAYRFDLLVCNLQQALLTASGRLDDLKGDLLSELDQLKTNLNQVKAKAETIREVRANKFWEGVTIADLERIRTELRSIMQHKVRVRVVELEPKKVDVTDTNLVAEPRTPYLGGQELIAYRHRVESVLRERFETHPILARIKAGHSVTESDLETLASEVLKADPQVNLMDLPNQIHVEGDLHRALRTIVGLDADAVDEVFTAFIHLHPQLTARQHRFIAMLKAHITTNGGLELERLYEAPFTTISAEGIDGVFSDDQIGELLALITRINQADIRQPAA